MPKSHFSISDYRETERNPIAIEFASSEEYRMSFLDSVLGVQQLGRISRYRVGKRDLSLASFSSIVKYN